MNKKYSEYFKKFLLIHGLAQKNNIDVLIETGTHLGYTALLGALSGQFRVILTVELIPELFHHALKLIGGVNYFFNFTGHDQEVIILNEDSTKFVEIIFNPAVPKLMAGYDLTKQLNDLPKSLIWLDAHNIFPSREKYLDNNTLCPLILELDSIKKHYVKNHVILIDDIEKMFGENRCERFDNLYPTLKQIKNKVLEINENYTFREELNILVCTVLENE